MAVFVSSPILLQVCFVTSCLQMMQILVSELESKLTRWAIKARFLGHQSRSRDQACDSEVKTSRVSFVKFKLIVTSNGYNNPGDSDRTYNV